MAVVGIILLMIPDNSPMMKDRQNREDAMYDIAQRRYTNVVHNRTVKTVRHVVSGSDSGTGSGGAASNKS